MPRHQEMRAVAHAQVRGRDPAALEVGELAAEERRSDDHPGTRTQSASGLKIPLGRSECSLKVPCWLTTVVAGVVAALESDDHIRFLREEISDLAFAFVAPLSTRRWPSPARVRMLSRALPKDQSTRLRELDQCEPA